MSSTLRIDELRTPRHPRWGVCYSGGCHVTAPMTALSKYADIRGPDAFNPHPRRGGVSRRHHRSPAVAMKPAGRDPRRPNGAYLILHNAQRAFAIPCAARASINERRVLKADVHVITLIFAVCEGAPIWT